MRYEPIRVNKRDLISIGFLEENGVLKMYPSAEVLIIFDIKCNEVSFYLRTIHSDYEQIKIPYEIEYLHQIQNVYFSLTNTELSVLGCL